jgi:hypothetical protein
LELCYTLNMERDRHIWRCWAKNLQQWGISTWAADFLESAGALTVLGAQFVYLSQPFLNLAVSNETLTSLARLLEDSSNKQIFVEYLREASAQ